MRNQCRAITVLVPIALSLTSQAFAHETVSLQNLSEPCRTAVSRVFADIKKHQPTREHFEKTSVKVDRDYKGNYSINFSALSGDFGPGELEEQMVRISKRLASSCPQVALISFSGPTWSNWTIRRDGFSRRHHKYDEQFPGDVDFYWNWNKLPFDYDPLKDYFSS